MYFDGLLVIFVVEVIVVLGVWVVGLLLVGFVIYYVMNLYDDGIGFDEYVDWLIEVGYLICCIDDFVEWL